MLELHYPMIQFLIIADTQRFSKGSIGGPIMELEKHYGKLNLDVLSVTWYRMLE